MKIPLKIEKNEVYATVYKILSDLRDWKLTKQDIKVFSTLLMKTTELAKTVPDKNMRMKLLFDKGTKKELISSIGTTYHSFANSLTRLKKIGLVGENSIDERYAFNIDRTAFNVIIQIAIYESNK
jgi:hypothetical protein